MVTVEDSDAPSDGLSRRFGFYSFTSVYGVLSKRADIDSRRKVGTIVTRLSWLEAGSANQTAFLFWFGTDRKRNAGFRLVDAANKSIRKNAVLKSGSPASSKAQLYHREGLLSVPFEGETGMLVNWSPSSLGAI